MKYDATLLNKVVSLEPYKGKGLHSQAHPQSKRRDFSDSIKLSHFPPKALVSEWLYNK